MATPPPDSPALHPDKRLLVSIELTNVCNYRCPFCPQAYQDDPAQPAGAPYNRKGGFMSRDVFERAVDECTRTARCVELGFFGEQTLHPDYIDYILHLGRHQNFRIETNTNISLLTRPMMDAWVDAGLDMVRLSVDAISPDLYNHVRPGPCKDLDGNTVEGDDRVAAVNEKIAYWLARADHRPTRIVYVKSSHNDRPGQREAFLNHWQPQLGPEDQVLLKRVLSYGGKITDPHIKAGRCNVWQVGYLVIGHDGTLSPCNLDTNLDLALGNLTETSVHNAYFGPRADALRKQTGCGNPITPCSTCTDGNNWAANETFGPTVNLRITA